MRILFFSYAYPNPWQPQLGTFNRTMIAGLAGEHAVRVVSPISFVERFKPRTPVANFSAVPGVSADYPTYYYTPKVLRDLYGQFLDWSVGAQVRRVVRDFRPDVVLSYWAHPDGEVAVRVAHENGLPAVVMVGGSDVLLLAKAGCRRECILKVLRRADAVVAVSLDIAEKLREDGVPARKIHVFGRGIDRTMFCPGDRAAARKQLGVPPDRPMLLGVGRLVPVKCWPVWISACRELVAKALEPQCYILGDGPQWDELEEMIRQHRLLDYVELRGPATQEELLSWYRAADLTVLSSASEGIPNVLLETIACGGSFVATNVGGIPEIADPVYDRLVLPWRSRALAEAIIDRLQHPPPPDMPRRWEPGSLQMATRRLVDLLGAVIQGVESRERSVPFVDAARRDPRTSHTLPV
jgi:glycosyltransferase involved in cell wall biosynthesis